MSDADSAGLERLDRGTCYALLRSLPIGRIVFTEGALPAIQPVNFVLDGDDVIIRTGMGSKLAAATRSAVVAFEADRFDEDALAGWSVVLVGRAEAVTGEQERTRLAALGLTPWAPGERPHYIRIRPEIVRGRRVPPQRPGG
ncbi:pyridoxamine 5'-phosphate oxidase family protein [Jiangella sp. DSM 45060]|uniref:pyridoxamine 5'-phosphate oxidase family protein n=1 Tax=Jiangella sp. DSM 45060 TaxID=1798224 RepID=UPI00087A2D92|nr:pyridoxamine 5'-phosphate oxidase family protein [Jiangella sp. DSM 45060]SDS57949.1 Nitroimidazol reductase NimA, pyridoxamine 5'-phosphate oxidase superfamily [Jiangella sp. DSM 45060]